MQTGKLLTIAFLLTSSQALASIVTYTSSAAFEAALSGTPTISNYGTSTAGTVITPGTTLEGITYTSFHLIGSSTQDGFISNQFNSFSGRSLGADENNGAAQFFFDGDSFTINFAPAFAIGVFFNVNASSGTYGITTAVGDANTGSATYDTSTFVFAGLISTTPFTSATIASNSGGNGTASYNIPEIILSSASAVPEPSTITVAALGAVFLAGLLMRRRTEAGRSNS